MSLGKKCNSNKAKGATIKLAQYYNTQHAHTAATRARTHTLTSLKPPTGGQDLAPTAYLAAYLAAYLLTYT